jgi:hypothetical protein
MAVQFEPGRYAVRIENQYFTESPQKGTLGFGLTFRVQKNLDQPDQPLKPFSREWVQWVTEATLKRVLHNLHVLGYAGDSLAGVDPDTAGFHDFRGLEVELTCVHEKDAKGEVFERWNLPSAKTNLKDKTQLRRFDRLLANHAGEAVAVRAADAGETASDGVTDDDVPF